MNQDNELVLTAEDGRNIEVVEAGGIVELGGNAPNESRIYRGGMILQSENNITIGDAVTGDPVPADNAPTAAATALLGDLASGATTLGVNTNNAVSEIDVTSREGSNKAIDVLDVALKQVAESRSSLGAVQNRMESTVRNLEVASENLFRVSRSYSRC